VDIDASFSISPGQIYLAPYFLPPGRDEQAGQNATADDFPTFGPAGRAGAREDLQTYWFAAQTINGSTLRGLLHENFSNTRRGHRYLSGGVQQGSRPEG